METDNPKTQQPLDSAALFKIQSEAQALMNLKATVVNIVLIDTPSTPFVLQALDLTQQLLGHLANSLPKKEVGDE